jgi:vacuolar-type H+-ATPase subunit H
MDMMSLIDELEAALQRAIHVPASGRILVDEATLRQIVAQMRGAAPDEVRLGQRIASERERILADARGQARRMLEDVQSQLTGRVDEQQLVQAARQRVREIEKETEQRAASLKADARQYVVGQLSSLEVRLQKIMREVQAGQRLLQQEGQERAESNPQS